MNNYLKIFQKAAVEIENSLPEKSYIKIKTGIWLNSVVLKIQNQNWKNLTELNSTSKSEIFFSVWLEEKSIKKKQMFYNIHAFKLRNLKGYKIESRDFAEGFRKRFKEFESLFPNVSVKHGPLTLMQGWIEIHPDVIENDILKLTEQFLKIQFIIDELLEERKL